jgi:hypothetical protein
MHIRKIRGKAFFVFAFWTVTNFRLQVLKYFITFLNLDLLAPE